MAAGAGERMMVGIVIDIDAQGAVQGAHLAGQAFDQMEAKAARTQDKFRERARGVQQGLSMAAGAATAIGASALAVGEIARRGILNPMIQESQEFEVQFEQVKFVTEATGAELEKLRRTAMETGLATLFSPAQAAEGLRLLKAAGLELNEVYQTLQPTLDVSIASAGMLDLATASKAMAAALQKFKHTGAGARDIADILSQAIRKTNIQFENFPVFINAMREFPIRFKATAAESMALVGVMRNMGQMPAQAGMALSQFANKILNVQSRLNAYRKTGKKLRVMTQMQAEAMESFGIKMFDAGGGLRSMTDMFIDMLRGMKRITNDQERMSKTSRLFGPIASAVAESLGQYSFEGRKGAEALEHLISVLEDSQGVSREAAATFERTFQGLKVLVVGTLKTIATIIGSTFLPIIKPFLKWLHSVLSTLSNFLDENPLIAKAIGVLIVGFIALSFALGILFLGLAAVLFLLSTIAGIAAGGVVVFSGIAAALVVVGKVLLGLFVFLALSFAWLVTVIGAFVYAFKTNLGGITDFVRDLFTDIKLIWTAMVDFWKSDDDSIDAILVDKLKARGILQIALNLLAFVRRLEEVWLGIKDTFTPFVEFMIFQFELIINSALWFAETIQDALKSMGVVFDENMSTWRNMGRIIGVILVGLAILAIGVLGTFTGVLILLSLPFLIFVATVGLIIGAVVTLLWFLAFLVDVVQAVGKGFVFFGEMVGEGFAMMWLKLVEWKDKFVSWVSDLGSDISEGFMEHIGRPWMEFIGIFQEIWRRLKEADAPWRAWAIPWYNKWIDEPIIQPIVRGFTWLKDKVVSIWEFLVSSVEDGIAWVANSLSSAWDWIVEKVTGAATAIANIFSSMWNWVSNIFSQAVSWIGGALMAFIQPILNFGSSVWSFFSGLHESLVDFFSGLIESAVNWGSGLIDAFLDGIKNKWSDLVGWISTNIVEVRDLLPHSDAKVGPLSDLTASGQSFVTTFATGVNTAFPGLTSAISTGLGSIFSVLGLSTTEGGGATTPISPVASISNIIGGGVDTPVSAGGASKTVTVNVGDISVKVQQATPEEAERLATMILDRIRVSIEAEGEATFA